MDSTWRYERNVEHPIRSLQEEVVVQEEIRRKEMMEHRKVSLITPILIPNPSLSQMILLDRTLLIRIIRMNIFQPKETMDSLNLLQP